MLRSMHKYLIWLLVAICGGCYTFKGISIDPEVNTFYIRNFDITADNAPPTLGLDFAERLRDKVRTETRLTQNVDSPDVEFTGRVEGYNVVPVAPKPGEIVALNRLEIRMKVAYKNLKNEKKGWSSERSFSHFAEFDNTTDLLSAQDRLIRQIGDQLLEDIFNAAFNDW
jgi:hypothetical protein